MIKVKDFPRYFIDEHGNFYDSEKNMEIKPIQTKTVDVYPIISLLNTQGKWMSRKVHRLLAIAFIPNPDNKPYVNHINGNKLDFRLCNLEWVTAKENSHHAHRIGLHDEAIRKRTTGKKKQKYEKKGRGKSIIGLNLDENKVLFFSSFKIANENGFNKDMINRCIENDQKKYKNFIWKYA